MSLRLQVHVDTEATPDTVWAEMTDWAGQARWIPLTTVKAVGPQQTGVGVRVVALSGLWLGHIPVGLLDNFVVTGWTPPGHDTFGELEVLHLGPFFTGEGAFRVETSGGLTRITATEVFSLPGGRLVESVIRPALPLMARGFQASLTLLRKVCESSSRGPDL